MTKYAAFEVYELNGDGAKTHIADAEVNVYKAADDELLDTLEADANGIVWPFELDVPAGTAIYYEYDDGEETWRGGQGVTGEFLYQDIIIAEDIAQSFYPTGNVEPVAVEVYVRDSADTNAAWRLHDRYAPTATASIPIALAQDRAIDIRVVSIAPDGTRNVSEVSHAPGETIDFLLVNSACMIGQAGAATENTVIIAVNEVAPTAVARRIRVYDSDETTLLQTFYNQSPLPITEQIFGSPEQVIYVKVDHSGTPGEAGPWGPVSNSLMLEFAAVGGGGGSAGDYDPYGRGYYEL